jgi:hypothetical protein
MYAKHAQLESMTRQLTEEDFGRMQEQFAAFIAAAPEERFQDAAEDKTAAHRSLAAASIGELSRHDPGVA